jgi:tetratricopeptide (TPR) repeat protein
LAKREAARGQLSEFNRLADEAQYFAANTDAISERVPYYDPRHANAVGKAALAIAVPWGPQAEQLPLAEDREEFLQAEYALLLLMARVHLQGNQDIDGPHAALAFLDQAQAIHTPSSGYYELRSRCLTLLGEHQAAQHAQAHSHQSETPVTAEDHFLQGELSRWEDVGSSAKVIEENSKPLRDNLVKAIDEYRHALQLEPRHYWARFQLGRCQLALGHDPEAVETLSACIAIRPNSPWAYTTRGLANARVGHKTEALADLDRAVQLDPEFQPARLNRGIVYWISGNTDQAVADFNAVLAAPVEKCLIEAAFYRGQLLLQKQQTREAFAEFSKVITERPNFRLAHWFRAQTQFRLGDFDAGEIDLINYVNLSYGQPRAIDPGQTQLLMGKALRRIALELDGPAKLQALSHAADRLHAAVSAGPPTAEAFQNLGAVDELLGKNGEAIIAYSKGLGLASENVRLLNLRGWAFATTKQFEQARADFTDALRLAPQNAESHAGLGYVLALLGSAELARAEASSALLWGTEDYLVLHNVACIYGQLSMLATGAKLEHENVALVTLQRAAQLSRDRSGGPNEIALMIHEEAFPDSLRSRPEFKSLISESSLDLP